MASLGCNINIDWMLDLLKEHKCLYDKTDQHFKNRDAKSKAWQSIADQMDVPSEIVQMKYRTQRTKLSKYLNGLRLERMPGNEAEEIVLIKELENIRWLVPFIKHRTAVGISSIPKRYDFPRAETHSDVSSEEEEEEQEESGPESGPESRPESGPESGPTISHVHSNGEVTSLRPKRESVNSISNVAASTLPLKRIKSEVTPVAVQRSVPKKNLTYLTRSSRPAGFSNREAKSEAKQEVEEDEDKIFCKCLIKKFGRVPVNKKSLVQWKLLKVFIDIEDEGLKLQQYQVITNDDGTVLEVRGCADADEAILLNDKGLKMAEWNKILMHPLTDAGLVKVIKAGFGTPEDVTGLVNEEAIEDMELSVRDRAAIRKIISPVDTSFLAEASDKMDGN